MAQNLVAFYVEPGDLVLHLRHVALEEGDVGEIVVCLCGCDRVRVGPVGWGHGGWAL